MNLLRHNSMISIQVLMRLLYYFVNGNTLKIVCWAFPLFFFSNSSRWITRKIKKGAKSRNLSYLDFIIANLVCSIPLIDRHSLTFCINTTQHSNRDFHKSNCYANVKQNQCKSDKKLLFFLKREKEIIKLMKRKEK